MARRRRPEAEEITAAPVVDAVEITPHDRLDPRVFLIAPDDIARDPERLLLWSDLHAPSAVLDEDAARARAETRARLRESRTPQQPSA